jgi:hypothetical protein
MAQGTVGDADEPEQTELLPIDDAERLARVEELRQVLERSAEDEDEPGGIVEIDGDEDG